MISEILSDMTINDVCLTIYYLLFIVGSMFLFNPFLGTIYFLTFAYMRWFRKYSIEVYNYHLILGFFIYLFLGTMMMIKETRIQEGTRLPWF